MGILFSRIASRLGPRLQPLFQTSRASFRQFSYGRVSPLATRLANRLPKASTVIPKYNFGNTTNITGDRSYLGSLAAAVVSCIAYWFFRTINGSSASAQASISEVKCHENIDTREQDLAAIAQKQGHLWECIDRKPDEFGGYIYHYKLRKEFDFETLVLVGHDHTKDENGDDELERVEKASEEKTQQIFPAAEPEGFEDVSEILEFVSQGRFKKFGYSIKRDNTGVYLCIPDQEALEARFEKIRKFHPGSKPLKILSSEDVADDLTFIKAYLKYDVILGEFVHDHFAHILPTLNLMLSFPEEYAIERERLRGVITTFLGRINLAEQMIEKGHLNDLKSQLPKIKTALGIAVDTLWAFPRMGTLENLNQDSFENTLLEVIEDSFLKFWEKKFGEKFDRDAFANHWEQLVNLKEISTIEPKTGC